MNVKNSAGGRDLRGDPARGLIVAASNIYLVQAIRQELSGRPGSASVFDPHRCLQPGPSPGPPPDSSKGQLTLAMMPKSRGNAYFIACRKGAEEAARGARRQADPARAANRTRIPAKQNNEVTRHLHHARGRRHRRGRREPPGDLVVLTQGAEQGHQGGQRGTPTPSPTHATSTTTRPPRRASARP